ncbi:hypothetical protein P7K49_020608, partial [Saguinus oedipus]
VRGLDSREGRVMPQKTWEEQVGSHWVNKGTEMHPTVNQCSQEGHPCAASNEISHCDELPKEGELPEPSKKHCRTLGILTHSPVDLKPTTNE